MRDRAAIAAASFPARRARTRQRRPGSTIRRSKREQSLSFQQPHTFRSHPGDATRRRSRHRRSLGVAAGHAHKEEFQNTLSAREIVAVICGNFMKNRTNPSFAPAFSMVVSGVGGRMGQADCPTSASFDPWIRWDWSRPCTTVERSSARPWNRLRNRGRAPARHGYSEYPR